MLALTFPPINELIRWRDVFPGLNKVGIIALIAAVLGVIVFMTAATKDPLKAPSGVRNLAESGVTFIENDIVMQTMGRDGLAWTPFLLSIFIFVYLCNVPGIIPFFQMPATARMAIPLFLALVVWVIYNVVGFKHNGLGYIGGMVWPKGVPVFMRPLVGVIEFLSNIILRPFSLAVRLFANMLAGHMLLITFAFLTNALVFAETKKIFLIPLSVLPFFMLVFLTAFEVLVGLLQAYIFTILTAVYIDAARHPVH
jgi:F-type H+-transporting ATPase subunit a